MRVSFNDSRKHILKINFDMDPDDFIRIMDQEPPVERFTDLIGFLSDIYERSEDPKKSRVVFVEKNVWVIDT
jgi:Fe-S-cluster formation regulator IscX/YfhJ